MLRSILIVSCLLVSVSSKLDSDTVNIMNSFWMKKWNQPPEFDDIDGDAGERLFLTPYIKSKQIDIAQNLSMVDSDIFPEEIESHAGFITVDEEKKSHLWFWYFPHSAGAAEPLVMWLEGGPGFPSTHAALTWLGPYKLNKETGNLTDVNPYTWHYNHSMLYIDNLVGTGYSFTESEDGYSTTTMEAAELLYKFMLQFLQLFPNMQEAPLYISGQSYGGKFSPALGYQIHHNNKASDIKMNLQGIAIWSGFIDPVGALDFGDIIYQLGFVDEKTVASMKETYLIIKEKKNNGTLKKYESFLIFNKINVQLYKSVGQLNSYNYGTDDFGIYELEYPKRLDVRKALHVGKTRFKDWLVMYSFAELLGDFMSDCALPWIAELMDNYKIMMLSGQMDLQIPYTLNMKAVHNLQWSGNKLFKETQRLIWTDGEHVAGYFRQAHNFTEVFLRNTGHFMVKDQPRRTESLMTSFTHDNLNDLLK